MIAMTSQCKKMKTIQLPQQHKNAQGFTLVEVLIAMALSTIALLGLAAAQLKSLQYATNSFNYTVSLIQANNAVERTWVNLCNLQSGSTTYDAAYFNVIRPQVNNYTMVLEPLPGAAFTSNLNITVSWTDNRLTDVAAANVNQNQAVIEAVFPNIC